jgi:hypothetical protein
MALDGAAGAAWQVPAGASPSPHEPASGFVFAFFNHLIDPSGMTLAHDIGLASLPPGVERIEFLLEALVGRFSGVNRAADGEPGPGVISPRHGLFSRLK